MKKRIKLLIFLLISLIISGCFNKSKESKDTSEFLKTFEMKRLNTKTTEELIPEKLEIPTEYRQSKTDYIDMKIINKKIFIILGSDVTVTTTISTGIRYKNMKLLVYDFQTKKYEQLIESDGDTSISFEYCFNDKIYLRKQTGNSENNNEQLGLLELDAKTDDLIEKIAMSSEIKDFVILGEDVYTHYLTEDKIKKSSLVSITNKEIENNNNMSNWMIKSESCYNYDYSYFNRIENGMFITMNIKTKEEEILFKTDSNPIGQKLNTADMIMVKSFYPKHLSGEENPINFLTLMNYEDNQEYLLFDGEMVNSLFSAKFQNEVLTPTNTNFFLFKDFKGDWARYHMKESVLIKEPIPNTENFKTTMAMNNGWFFLSDGKSIFLIK
ncbi:hypothetical protein ACYSNR_12825 [Enterococcus sp. LJL128]